MTRNFNFLIDAFKNLSGEYKFGIFIHEDNWEIFYKYLSQHLDISLNSLSRAEITENFIFLQNKNSKMFIYKIHDYTSQIRGQRYNFVFWDELLKSPIVNEIIKPCAILSPGVMLSLHFREKCNYCICKTCAIAEINGGAPGCGNCKDCHLIDGCRSCNEYYNPEPIRRSKNDNRN